MGRADTLEVGEVVGTADTLEVAAVTSEVPEVDTLEVAEEAAADTLEVVDTFKAARWVAEAFAWMDSDRMWVARPVARVTLTTARGAIIATTPKIIATAMVF